MKNRILTILVLVFILISSFALPAFASDKVIISSTPSDIYRVVVNNGASEDNIDINYAPTDTDGNLSLGSMYTTDIYLYYSLPVTFVKGDRYNLSISGVANSSFTFSRISMDFFDVSGNRVSILNSSGSSVNGFYLDYGFSKSPTLSRQGSLNYSLNADFVASSNSNIVTMRLIFRVESNVTVDGELIGNITFQSSQNSIELTVFDMRSPEVPKYDSPDDSVLQESEQLESQLQDGTITGQNEMLSLFTGIGDIFSVLGSGILGASNIVQVLLVEVPILNSLLMLSLSLGITAFLLVGGVTLITKALNNQSKSKSNKKGG